MQALLNSLNIIAVSEDVHRIELGEAHVRQHFFVTVQVEESPKEFRKLLKELEGKDSAKFSVGVECQCKWTQF